jgi:hypothetical protein
MITWQEFERKVRAVSEVVWCSNAQPEVLNGVKCDCVIKYKPDYWVLVEISKESTLEKLRTDLAKLSAMRSYLMSKCIYSECYFVTMGEQSSLIETGKGLNVNVHTFDTFASLFLGASEYIHLRSSYPFGSAVDPDSGAVDLSAYVKINYEDQDGKRFGVKDITDNLLKGKKIVLLGEFGTGKSRCLMEVFKLLSKSENCFFPVAINLRDNWGYKKFSHIIHNHIDDLGLGDFKDSLVRSIQSGNHPILLDGFDEIGAQSWSGDVARLSEIRKRSLQGVRDLLVKCKNSGVLITGREHYFNNNKEMKECLGLDEKNLIILTCPDEFTNDELDQYIKSRVDVETYPAWLPKKPLLCQLLTRIDNSSLKLLVESELGEVEFFEKVFDDICEREAKIHPTIFKDSLKSIMLELSTLSRKSSTNVGPINPTEINFVFEKVTGSAPIDESAIVLQRLPYLGRSGSESADRMFIDDYAVDGLRGLALIGYYYEKDQEIWRQSWKHPLRTFGCKIAGSKMRLDDESIKYFKNTAIKGNNVACSDFIASVLTKGDDFDFKDICVNNGSFYELDLCGKKIKNLKIGSSEVFELIVDNFTSVNFRLDNCIVERVVGVTSKDGFPSVFTNMDVIKYEEVITASRISELKLSDKQKTLLSILKKLFFQPGKGRKEDALLRGTERYWDCHAAEDVLRYMLKEKMVDRFKGQEGLVYFPNRSKTERVRRVMSKLNNSTDELWTCI